MFHHVKHDPQTRMVAILEASYVRMGEWREWNPMVRQSLFRFLAYLLHSLHSLILQVNTERMENTRLALPRRQRATMVLHD